MSWERWGKPFPGQLPWVGYTGLRRDCADDKVAKAVMNLDTTLGQTQYREYVKAVIEGPDDLHSQHH